MQILGVSAFYHDSAAALIIDGQIVAAAQEERFTRKKHDASFPVNAARFCLQYGGCSLNDLDAVVFYEKPFLKFERLLETYYAYAPRGLTSFMTAMPAWIKEKLFLKKLIWDSLDDLEKVNRKKVKLLFPEHHLSHAASAFYPSPFGRAAIITIDGVGEWATASICLGENNSITVLKELNFPHSLGLLYSAFTWFCGFTVNSGEYKLMGLAPYGLAQNGHVEKYKTIIREKLVDLKQDGSVYLDQEYFNYATGLRMINESKWEKLFGMPRRKAESALTQEHCDIAMAIQDLINEAVLNMAREAKALTQADYLCMAGGVALNCVANGKLDEARIFKQLFIQPAAGDAGGALGAALAGHYIYFGQERKQSTATLDGMQGSLLGNEFSEKDIMKMIRHWHAAYEYIADEDALLQKVAKLIAEGNVTGWHQGRMEFGPRALGARSILADARNPDMQKHLNLKIKHRESFRPFAPIVTAESVSEYFEQDAPSPYMLLVKKVKRERQIDYPENLASKGLMDRLYFNRSDIPAVTHLDYSARLQTVHQQTNPRLWKLLQAFKKLTGYPVLINTSFNVRGEPIVNSPEDAYRCFMRTDMDYLAIGNYLFDKKNQPVWREKTDWKNEIAPD